MRLKIVKLSSKSISNFENELSVSFEILPSKLKKFENSLKLPGVLFSISLIIYNNLQQYSWLLYTQTLKTTQVGHEPIKS